MNASDELAQTLRDFRQSHPLHSLQLGSGRWEYLHGGSGERTVLIAGGGGSLAESMFTVNVALEANCRVVSLSIPTTVSTVEEVVAGMEAILDSAGVGQAILLGHSLGGMIAQAFAPRHPRRVAGLVLTSTGFYLGARAVLLPQAARLMARLPSAMLLRLVGSQMRRLLQQAEAADFWMDFYRQELGLPEAGARLRQQSLLLAKLAGFFRQNPIHAGLPWISTMPVQIIASEDDRGFTRREVAALGALYPCSQTLTMPRGAGHLNFLTRPREYMQAVQAFIADRVGVPSA
jgi:pimeloyl-ACP methyl ester carboxylesterase